MPTTAVDDTRIHWEEAGDGEPALVLLHAFPLHSGMWAPQLRALGRHRLVVAPDFPGFGRSDVPGDPGDYSMAGYADQVAGLLDHLGLERVVLGGLSMGGYVAFALLRAHAEKVAGLVLADTRSGADTPEVLERRTNQQRQVVEEGTEGVIETQLGTLLCEPTHRDRPELVEQVRRLMADNPPAGFVGALEAMKQRPDVSDDLPGISVPTLFLVGEHDAVSSPEVMGEMRDRVPGSRLVTLPSAGHLSNLEATDEFNRAVEEFLSSL